MIASASFASRRPVVLCVIAAAFLIHTCAVTNGKSGVNPLSHFDMSGWKEDRIPSINFDPAQYLSANSDVAAANIDPLGHFLANGAQEGRQPFAPSELIVGNGFDYVYYLNNNPDVKASGADPFQHFQTFGWKEGRNPNALFDTKGYLNTYTDVKAANEKKAAPSGEPRSSGFRPSSSRASTSRAISGSVTRRAVKARAWSAGMPRAM